MKSNSVNYLVVGVFVMAMLAATVVLIATLSGRTGPTDAYYTRYDEVTGIKFGTKVLFMGFPIGQVENVTPVWNDNDSELEFALEMSISTDWRDRIPQDSVAEIHAGGLLAAVVIDIRSGESDQPLKPGATIEGFEGTDLIASLTRTANTIQQLTLTDVKPLIQNITRRVDKFGEVLERDGGPLISNLRAVSAEISADAPEIVENVLEISREIRVTNRQLQALLGPENSKNVEQILVNAKDATANVAAFTADEKIDQTLVHVKNASEHLDTLTGNAKTRLDDLLSETTVTKVRASLDNFAGAAKDVALAAKNVAQLSRELRETRSILDHFIETLDHVATENRPDVRDAVKDLRQAMDVVNHHIGTIAQNLEGTSRNMREFSRQIRQNPGALLGGKPPSDTAQY